MFLNHFIEGSGDLAKIAILATFRDKFWETNDLLYKIIRQNTKEIPLKKIADSTGLDVNELAGALIDPTISVLLRRDIWRGMKLGIIGTPTYVIGNKVVPGLYPGICSRGNHAMNFVFLSKKKTSLQKPYFTYGLLLLFITPGGHNIFTCFCSPISRDALTHHLYLPRLYLQHGGIYEIPDLVFSYYPMNLDLLYIGGHVFR